MSNIFQIDFFRSKNDKIPQTTPQARTYANDGAINWRGSGKLVVTSPLRDDAFWSALRISVGRNMDIVNNTGQGYLFAETPMTWEASSKIAFNFNPKYAWSGVGNLWGMGLSANIQIAPNWELIPEMNIILNKQSRNETLNLRWNVTDNFAIEAYGSTASSIIDIGQLLDAGQIRWGGRIIAKFLK